MTHRPHRLRLLAAAIALGLTSLTGCTTVADDPDQPPTGAERISLAMLLPPRSGLTPLSDDAFKLSRWSTGETLIVLDSDGNAEPGLATAWEQDDDLTWRFTIRGDVTFHDGTDLTPEAVVNSLTVANEAAPRPRILDGVTWDVSADDGDVVIVTDVPDPLVPQRLSSPQLTILAARAYQGTTVVPVEAGTGPFVLTEVNGTSSATLERFDDYWGEPAQAAGIDVQFVPDGQARAAALRTGTADIVEAIPVSQAALLDQELVHEVAMPRTNTLYLNNESGPFADPGVRAAAAAAVDRVVLVADVYEDRADVAEGLLGPALPWAADLRELDEYREILNQATPPATVDGVEITLGTFTDRSELPEVATLLQQQLEAAGFVVTQDVREYAYIEQDALDGAFDAFILSRATVLDSGDPVAYLYSDFACEGSFNISQVCDPEIDAAIEAAAAAPVGEGRQEAIARAEAIIVSRHVAVPMLHERVIQGESARVTDAERDSRERALISATTRIE